MSPGQGNPCHDDKGKFCSEGGGVKGPAGDAPVRSSDTRADNPSTSRAIKSIASVNAASLHRAVYEAPESYDESGAYKPLAQERLRRLSELKALKPPNVNIGLRESHSGVRSSVSIRAQHKFGRQRSR